MPSYEAEIKYLLNNPEHTRHRLTGLVGSQGLEEEYFDHYFIHSIVVPAGSERELRVRRIAARNTSKSLLTFKDLIVDSATNSKLEHEVEVASADAMIEILRAMGFISDIAFKKLCTNWHISWQEFTILATMVNVPEVAGSYLELEALVKDSSEVERALKAVRELAATLSLYPTDETREAYTDAVRVATGSGGLA